MPQVYTSRAYIKTKASQACIAQTQAYINRYDALRIEDTNKDDDTEETPLIKRVEEARTPTPIFNNEWEQIDDFIRQNEEYYRVRGITSSNTKATTTLSLIKTPDTMQWNNELKHQQKSTFLIPSYSILLHLIPLILGVRRE